MASDFIVVLSLVSLALGNACSGSESSPRQQPERSQPGNADVMASIDVNLLGQDNLGEAATNKLSPIDPHGLLGIAPSHGPFTGGQRALIRGRGFTADARVWIGETEVSSEQVFALQSDRLQISLPPGLAGIAHVTVQNGSDETSRRRLEDAYLYDAFLVEPSEGPTSGGTAITITGASLNWTPDSQITVDRNPCEFLSLTALQGDLQQLKCQLPPGTEGLKTVAVQTEQGEQAVLASLRYVPGIAPRGGISGALLDGQLTITVVATNGQVVPEATVILGAEFELTDLDEPGSNLQRTDSNGVAIFSGESLGLAEMGSGLASIQLTVAADCFQPLTLIGVEMDTVRAELSAVNSPACAEGNPQLRGGVIIPLLTLKGQLVWKGGIEFQRAVWGNVPIPIAPGQFQAAYLFQPSGSANAVFQLPQENRRIDTGTPGLLGYDFQLRVQAGNKTVYALAGIEDRTTSPARFTAYAMGSVHGLYGEPGETIEDIVIGMNRTLDQQLTLEVVAPAPNERGPHRIVTNVSVQLPTGGFAIFPNLSAEFNLTGSPSPTASSGSLNVIGLPALLGNLAGGRYFARGRALSDEPLGPTSVLPSVSASDPNELLALGDFMPVPRLSIGTTDGWSWNHKLGVEFQKAASSGINDGDPNEGPALIRYRVTSGSGLVTWTIATPPDVTEFLLPDISRLSEGGLVEGPLAVTVSLARITDFDARALRTAHLRAGSWQAFSTDSGQIRLNTQ